MPLSRRSFQDSRCVLAGKMTLRVDSHPVWSTKSRFGMLFGTEVLIVGYLRSADALRLHSV